MRRREFIRSLGGAAIAWPLAATRAQQGAMPVIGFLHSGVPEEAASRIVAFRRGLSETGYEDGRNVTIEFRWARYDNARLSELAADLVRLGVAVIAAPASTPAALAAKASTTTIPVVFSIGGDPVESGLVPSLDRPGGNVTGFTSMNGQLTGKQLGLLHELLPSAASFAVLINPNNPLREFVTKDAQAAGAALGRQIIMLAADSPRAITTAFAALKANHVDALLISPDIMFDSRHTQIVTLAARHAVPTISFERSFAEAGGLMSYGTSLADVFRQTGILVGRILKGERPSDLPVARPTKFEFVINLQTATVIGLDIPATLTARADEVIE
jgi:putative tryptophan/tyrosine transport system substrate-binding protein